MNIHTVCAELFLADGQTDVAFRNFCERAHKLWWFNHPITSFLKINNAIMASMLLPLVTENVLELCMYVCIYIYVHTCVCVCVCYHQAVHQLHMLEKHAIRKLMFCHYGTYTLINQKYIVCVINVWLLLTVYTITVAAVNFVFLCSLNYVGRSSSKVS